MQRRRKLQFAIAAGVILLARAAVADPSPTPPHGTTGGGSPITAPLHLESDATCRTSGGTDLRLPPGYFLSEPEWTKLDAETRRLQATETSLKAENASLTQTLSSWQPGWWTLGAAVVSGAALGWYLHGKF